MIAWCEDLADYTGGSTLQRENIYRGGLLATYEAGAYKYLLQDAQGSTRAVMSNLGGSSTVLARHDYLPFGEEIGSGIGPRTPAQGYGATDTNRQKYGLTERDDTMVLDHTGFRKYESVSGRWISPDPYGGSMSIADPQSFNRFAYVQNDPENFVDPIGLDGPGAISHIDPAHGPSSTTQPLNGMMTIGASWSILINSLKTSISTQYTSLTPLYIAC